MPGYRQWRLHLDEVSVKINGEGRYLWRLVGHEGEILESFVIVDLHEAWLRAAGRNNAARPSATRMFGGIGLAGDDSHAAGHAP